MVTFTHVPALAEQRPSWHHLRLSAIADGTGGQASLKTLSAIAVVVLLVLVGLTGDLGSTPSQEGVVRLASTPGTTDTSPTQASNQAPSRALNEAPTQALDEAIEAYLAGFTGRPLAVAAAVPRTGGSVHVEFVNPGRGISTAR